MTTNERQRHHRRGPPSVRPVRQDGHGDGRRGDPVRTDRRRSRLEGHPVRLRRQPRGLEPRCGDPAGRSHRHHVHQRLQRLRHLGSAIQQTADTIRLGKYDIGIAIGMDKHPRGAFTDDPAKLALPQWYAENGQFVTTKFFGMKANHYLPRARHLPGDAGEGGGQELPQRRAEPECVPAQAHLRGRDPHVAGAQLPADPVHVLRARRGRCGGDHVPRRHRAPVHRRRRCSCGPPRSAPAASAPTRCTPRRAPLEEDASPTVYAAKAAYEAAGIGPEDVDVAQLQDTDAGAEVIHMAETGLCATASRRSCSPTAPPRSVAPCRSTPTAG